MSRRAVVLSISLLAIIGFVAAAFFYNRATTVPQATAPVPQTSALVRFNAPSFGPANAPVTIVEFFDPSCESCRAFYPIVKKMMSQHPSDVLLVLRYVRPHVSRECLCRCSKLSWLLNLATIERDAADAKTGGVKGTPTFFVNVKPLNNFGNQQLYDLIWSEVNQAR